jgi:hypothetical protein
MVLALLEFDTGLTGNWGYAVAQLVEELRYKTEGSGFETRWYHCDISST